MNVAELKPLRDVVIVKATLKENTTKGGIVTSTKEDKEKASEGTVIAAGPKATCVAVGDTVAFTTNVIREDKFEGSTYLWMTTENVLGVVSKG